VEVARAEDGGLPAVELAEPREQDRADGHVDADAEGVGSADDLQQALLRELLDEHSVLRQQAGVMQADAVPQPLADLRAVRARETEIGDGVSDGRLLVPRADLEASEVLGAAGRVGLREVDDVRRRLAFFGELLERVRQRISAYAKSSGTGRSVDLMLTVGLPLSAVSASSKTACRREWPTSGETACAAA